MDCCNHTSITFLGGDHLHRWYGCNDCGSVFEVSAHAMVTPKQAAEIMVYDLTRQAVLKFRSRHQKPPQPNAPSPPEPSCEGCKRPPWATTHVFTHTCGLAPKAPDGDVPGMVPIPDPARVYQDALTASLKDMSYKETLAATATSSRFGRDGLLLDVGVEIRGYDLGSPQDPFSAINSRILAGDEPTMLLSITTARFAEAMNILRAYLETHGIWCSTCHTLATRSLFEPSSLRLSTPLCERDADRILARGMDTSLMTDTPQAPLVRLLAVYDSLQKGPVAT